MKYLFKIILKIALIGSQIVHRSQSLVKHQRFVVNVNQIKVSRNLEIFKSASNSNSFHRKNQEKNIIVFATPNQNEGVSKLTVEELKTELKKHGLRVSGRKSELIQRLIEAGGPKPLEPERTSKAAETMQPEILGVGSAEAFRAEEQERRYEEQQQKYAQQNKSWKFVEDVATLTQMLDGISPVIDDLMIRREVKIKTPSEDEFDAYIVQPREALQPWNVQKGLQKKYENQEVQTVVLIPDMFGWDTEFIRTLADSISAVCEAIVLVPDIYQGKAWVFSSTNTTNTSAMQTSGFQQWTSSLSTENTTQAIRQSAAHLVSEFNSTSMGIVGFSYGGGRAIEEAATGVLQLQTLVAFYPTHFNTNAFKFLKCPTLAIFASEDMLPGATKAEAKDLHDMMSKNEEVEDFVVRIFNNEDHGFAHLPGASKSKSSAEDALLLATAWLQLYLRRQHRTTGIPAKMEKAIWED